MLKDHEQSMWPWSAIYHVTSNMCIDISYGKESVLAKHSLL